MAIGPWITVSFAPATAPLYAHKVNPRDSDPATLIDEVVGWLVQHRYDDAKAFPINSRVVAGIVSDGQVCPARDATMSIGVYRAGETPSPAYIEAARQSRESN
jgi:hypothetical protein